MNVLDSIDSVRDAQAAQEAASDSVGKNQFLEMLVAQLENQDPLSPQDSADFAAQLAQFSTVEQLIAMRTGIDDLVKVIKDQAEGGGAAAKLDPASLVGREVVVFGSQIEVAADRSPIEMPIRSRDTAVEAKVKIFDSKGELRYQGSILERDANGREIALRPGDTTFRFDPAAHNMGEGTYRIEFSAKGTDGEPVTLLPMVTGIVTGAVVAGTPAIRIGSRLFAIEDVLEVRLAPGTSGAGTDDESSELGGTGGGIGYVAPTGKQPS